jgi:hypothetical protein
MRTVTLAIGAAAFGLALVSGAAMAQNQGGGPSSPDIGVNSNPATRAPTGGNAQTTQPTNPNARQGTLYNYAPGQGNNQAQPQQRRGTTGYKH